MLRSNLAPISGGEVRGGMGFGAGAGYAYHFNPQMSLRTGLELNSYSGTSYAATINGYSTITIPAEWDWKLDYSFDFLSSVKNYSVVQTSLYLQVPLLFGYEDAMPWLDWVTWYAHGGVKLGYSIFGSSKATADSIRLIGNFSETGSELGNDPNPDEQTEAIKKWLALGSYNNSTQRTTQSFGFSSAGYLEVGVKQKLMQQYSLYVGIFGEYSMYSAVGVARKDMYEYEALPSTDTYYKIHYTPASHTSSNQSRTFYPMSFGLTLRLSFDTKRQEPSNNRMLQMRYLDF